MKNVFREFLFEKIKNTRVLSDNDHNDNNIYVYVYIPFFLGRKRIFRK